MRLWIAVAGLFAVASPVAAQSPPVAGPTSSIGWEQTAATLADAQGFSYAYALDAAGPVPLAGHKCGTGPAAGEFTCAAPLPAVPSGPHSITLTASSAAGASLPSSPLAFVFATLPAAPRNLRILAD